MAPQASARGNEPVTWDEYLALPEEDSRELIDGELLEVEVPNELHEWIVAALCHFLVGWCLQNGGRVHASGLKVKVSETRGVMPDVQLSRSLRGAGTAPDLVVEVISPGSRRYDRVTKLHYYRTIGVPEYWIVDPDARTIERFVLDEASYRLADALAEPDVFEPGSLPGLAIPLRTLFEMPG